MARSPSRLVRPVAAAAAAVAAAGHSKRPACSDQVN